MLDQLLMPIVASLILQHASSSLYGTIAAACVLLLNAFQREVKQLASLVGDALGHRVRPRRTHLDLTARISSRNNSLWSTNYPRSFLAVNRRIQSELLGSAAAEACHRVHEFHQHTFSDCEKAPVVFFELPGRPRLRLAPSVRVCTRIESERGEKDFSYTTLIIRVCSGRGSYADIKRFVDEAVREYDSEMVALLKDQQHVFVFDHYSGDKDAIVYREIAFSTTKTFDNMFFDDKDTVVRALDAFASRGDEYARLGLPHTLGFLFHGTQGSGKTSCIKCIAKRTGRHIVLVSMKRVKDIDTLRRVFLDPNINGVCVPNNRRLYVFEEIDCGPWASVVAQRGPCSVAAARNESATAATELLEELVTCIKSSNSHAPSGPKAAPNLSINLGELLELLDGIVEVPGRIIIMTSNHPDSLDRALVRPGRIDHVVEFRPLRRGDVAQLYTLWFGTPPPDGVLAALPERTRFTQAELGNLFATRDPERIHAGLTGEVAAA